MEDRSLAYKPWHEVSKHEHDGRKSLPAPHGQPHSCLVNSLTTSTNLTFPLRLVRPKRICGLAILGIDIHGHGPGCERVYPPVDVQEITDVGIISRDEDGWCCVHRHGLKGWVKDSELRPLKVFSRKGAPDANGNSCSLTMLRMVSGNKSSYVKTAQGRNVEIPDGRLVALLDTQGEWMQIAVILGGVKHIGFVRKTYVHDPRF